LDRPPSKIDVLLVEDDRLLFEGLSILLADEQDLRIVGVATTAAEAVEKAKVLEPDVILMDYHLPDGDGAQATARIRDLVPDASILFLSADTSEDSVARAIESGASGYVSKTAPADELVTSIRRAAEGEYLVEAATIARLADEKKRRQLRPSQQQLKRAARLTAPETAVLAHMANGLDNVEIAGALDLEPPAVRGHVRRILEKLGTHSKAQAVVVARDAGLIEA
jgi:DNA-binding NarL/FixJ family response regulator